MVAASAAGGQEHVIVSYSRKAFGQTGERGRAVRCEQPGRTRLVGDTWPPQRRRCCSRAGDGHFSPIGGYSAARDLVLVLDTARFKYSPHWVPLEMMYS